MTTKSEIQDLLRFLTQDAKIPLKDAMPKIKVLQEANLTRSVVQSVQVRFGSDKSTSPAQLAKSDIATLQQIFPDSKTAKKVLDTAKRTSKKRSSTDVSLPPSAKKSKVAFSSAEPLTPAATEASLALPTIETNEEEISRTVLHTNRAPLVLAFAVTLLKYTMPHQPLSSRLSLAQAVVSANSRSKAVSIGVESGPSAEAEGYGAGQPKVTIMGREISALKRWGYDPDEGTAEKGDREPTSQDSDATLTEEIIKPEPGQKEPALWGLDLEALRSSSATSSSVSNHDVWPTPGLPIYTPPSARAYLLKSFASPPFPPTSTSTSPPKKKPTAAALAAEKERNLALLLAALDILFASWAKVLGKAELDRRAWSWYVAVRPDVEGGVRGWGGKGEVRLGEILGLRRGG